MIHRMREFMVVGAVAAILCACGHGTHAPLRPSDYVGTIRIACVGDSITYGAGIEDREHQSYPAQLGRLLGTGYETRNFGVNGATLLKKGDKPYWDQEAFAQVTHYQPHAIVIKLGTNDSKPINWKYKNEFAGDLQAMIDHFAALPTHPRIWLCDPVPVYGPRWGISEAVVKGEIIPIVDRVAAANDLPVIDLYAVLSGHPELFPDQIHPNAAGAALMAMEIQSALTGPFGKHETKRRSGFGSAAIPEH